MTKRTLVQLMEAQSFPLSDEEGEVPEWIHLTPIGVFGTHDRRGPYLIDDPEAVIRASFALRGEIDIDADHATFKPGMAAPSYGWISEMEVRESGIWGQVNWTPEGRQLVASRAYRRISPALSVEKSGSKRVVAILNASLINQNNLQGLVALNQEENTDMFQETVAGWLGLNADASEADIETAIKAQGNTTELQSQMGEIATLFGVEDGGDILAAAKAAKTGSAGGDAVVTELQSAVTTLQGTVTELQGENQTLRDDRKRDQAEAYVDGEIKKGRIGLKPQRDTYVEMHQENPDRTSSLIEAMPIMAGTVIAGDPPETGDTVTELNAQELSEKAVALVKKRAEEGVTISITEAVNTVKEAKA